MKAQKRKVTYTTDRNDKIVISGEGIRKSAQVSAKVKVDSVGIVTLATSVKQTDTTLSTAFNKLSESQKLRRVFDRLSQVKGYSVESSFSKMKEAHFAKFLAYRNEQVQAIQTIVDLYNKEIAKYSAFVYDKDENPSGILKVKRFSLSENTYVSLFTGYLAGESVSVKAETEKFSAEIRKAVDVEIASKMQDFASHVAALETLSQSKDEDQAEAAKSKLAYLRKIEAFEAKRTQDAESKLDKIAS